MINTTRDERNALKAVDAGTLDNLIEQSLKEKRPNSLWVLRIDNCGVYATSKLRSFERALAEYSGAKAPKKLAETECCARHAGRDLAHAVQQMKYRVAEEEKASQLFYVDDIIIPPHRLSEHITVRVSYRWRAVVEDEWHHGSITFSHDVNLRPDHNTPLPRRKPSANTQEQDRQDKLYREWEHLRQLGLHSVQDFFRQGGNAAAMPRTFQAKADSYTRGLNNFSLQFWGQP